MSVSPDQAAAGPSIAETVLTPELALAALQLIVLLFLIRSILYGLGRLIGAAHPAWYRWWPRTGARTLIRFVAAITRWREMVFRLGKVSTAGLASPAFVSTYLYRPGRFHLGRIWAAGFGWLQPVGIDVSRHLFFMAQTGAGKTTAVISMISLWAGSAFIIDPKGQITYALARHDRDRRWVVIEPYGKQSAAYNAFDTIKHAMAEQGDGIAVLWAFRIAEALIVTPEGSRSPFFTNSARGFLAALILHVLTTLPPSQHNLITVRRLLVEGVRVHREDGTEEPTTEEERHELLYMAMSNNTAFNGAVSGGVSAIKNAAGETAGNVRATLNEQTKWLDIPQVHPVLSSTDLPPHLLKTLDDVVLSLVLPVLSVREELAPLARLLTNMMGYAFQDERTKKGQCLAVIDELPAQGHNAALEVMIPVARSQGLTVLGISQNIELLRAAYPKTYNIFLGEADAVLWSGINHKETSEHLSSLLHKRTLVKKDAYSGELSYRDVDVLSPDQVRRFLDPNSGNLIVTRAGGRAFRLKNDPYYKALPVWRYAPDPDHKEAFLRRLTRRLFDSNRPGGQT